MNSSFDLYSLKSAETFRIALMNLAVNSPDDFLRLMRDVPNILGYSPRKNPFRSFYDRHVVYGAFGGRSSVKPVSDDEVMERFAERCAEVRGHDRTMNVYERTASPPPQYELEETAQTIEPTHDSVPRIKPMCREVCETIRHLQYSRAADAIIYLLERSLPEVQKSFLNNFLSPDELARRAHVTMVVRHNPRPPRGNIGHYLIFASKEGGGSDCSTSPIRHRVSTT